MDCGGDAGLGEGVRLTEEQRLDWLRLIRSDNVGPRTFRDLVNHFGGARAALEALPGLARRGGAAGAQRICPVEEAAAELKAAKARGVSLIALGEPDYPARLQMIDDPPPLIAVRGQLSVLARPTGRHRRIAQRFRRRRQIRASAWRAIWAAPATPSCRGWRAASTPPPIAQASLTGTIAVLAGGHERIYPAEHVGLLDEIMPHGAAVSEMPLAWEPRARDFPRRNRLISGLAVGVVIVEAARRSGSLITARFAGEQGREVFAVPGSPLDPRAEGTNGLSSRARRWSLEAADVIAVLEPILGRGFDLPPAEEPAQDALGPPDHEPGEDERSRIVSLLGPSPTAIDDLVRLSQTSPAIVRTVLLELELAGRLERHGGGLVSLL